MNADPCPLHIKAVEDLDINKYTGKWHEMYRVKGSSGETGNCTTAKYNLTAGGIGVYNMDWFGQKPNQTTNRIYGKATQPDGKTGALRVKFDNFFIPEAPYNVISTDYDSYSIVYSCSLAFGVSKFEFMWVLTRDALEVGSTAFNDFWSSKIKPEIE